MEKRKEIPPLNELINVYDFQSAAKHKLLESKPNTKESNKDKDAFIFYETGVFDECTLRENQQIYSRIWLRPRILIGVNKKRHIDTNIELFNGLIKTSVPFYISATTRSNLCNKNGEIDIVKAAYNENIAYMLPAASSIPFNKIIKNVNKTQLELNLLW